jgi:hypothetical protein
MTEARRQQLLHAIVDTWDRVFDSDCGLLRASGNTATGAVVAGYESLRYALALLETAERSRVGRAEAILHTVLDGVTRSLGQSSGKPDVAPEALTDVGMILLLVWHRHRRRLSAPLSQRLTGTIPAVALRIRENTPSARELFILLATGEMYFDDTLIRDALVRLPDLRPKLRLMPSPANDFSANLIALYAIENHVRHPDALRHTKALLVHAWQQIAFRHRGAEAPAPPAPIAVLANRITFGAAGGAFLSAAGATCDCSDLLLSLVVNPWLPNEIADMLTAAWTQTDQTDGVRDYAVAVLNAS